MKEKGGDAPFFLAAKVAETILRSARLAQSLFCAERFTQSVKARLIKLNHVLAFRYVVKIVRIGRGNYGICFSVKSVLGVFEKLRWIMHLKA